MRVTQQSLFNQINSKSQKREQERRLTHGGEKSKGKRKLKRPLATKKWIHLTLKSNVAKGKLSMLAANNVKWIDTLVKAKANKFGVEIKELVNMGNHLHFQIRIANREKFQNFLRSITNLIARYVTGARKGKRFGKFWSSLAYTRVLTSSFEVWGLRDYLTGNRVERQHGFTARESFLTKRSRIRSRSLIGYVPA